ncbi:MAG: HypC/HybG/HupF family hydrogenase formation chaperone [Burkholderiales bacterium]|jgi:hydrogenase expression/formation protein HypC|nr:HypC/HybG/HupF family hydrogenase formation chaperone [Burkholderiales bacterium]
MCLAIPARILEIRADDWAIVELSGVRCAVSLALVDDAAIDDYVIVHVGYALAKLDQAEAKATLRAMEESSLLEDMGQGA